MTPTRGIVEARRLAFVFGKASPGPEEEGFRP